MQRHALWKISSTIWRLSGFVSIANELFPKQSSAKMSNVR